VECYVFESFWECDFYGETVIFKWIFLLEHRVCEFGCLVGYFIWSDGRCFCEGLQIWVLGL